MKIDSNNVQPPDFGPGFPTYPHLPQICRVTSASRSGTAYPAFTSQFFPPLSFRDREPCYVIEPNNISLQPGYYDCRLVGSYQSQPLYATTCCPTPSSSSSPNAVCNVTRTSLGSVQQTGVFTISLGPVTVAAGQLLVVVTGSAGTFTPTFPTATFMGNAMSEDGYSSISSSPVIGSLFILSSSTAGTGNIVITYPPPLPSMIVLQAALISGLAHAMLDVENNANNVSPIPPEVTGSPITSTACEYAQGAFFLAVPGGAWTWQNGFTSGGQDETGTIFGSAVAFTEGYNLLSATQSVSVSLGGVTPADWCGLLVTYQ